MKILISGIAGDVGISIGRILQRSELNAILLGYDVHNEHYADDIFQEIFTMPRVDSISYFSCLQELIKQNSIDVFIPSSEPELRWFSKNLDSARKLEIPCIMANQYAMEIGFDKLGTAKHLRASGLTAPWSELVSELPDGPSELPCILKSRYGAGNSTVYLVDDKEKTHLFSCLYPQYMWQEYLPGTHGEFTCGVYRCLDDTVRVIIMRRRLSSGATAYAQVVKEASIEQLCKQIAESLNLRGSINIQLRIVEGKGPVVFEINPRFSSTVSMRDKLGFRDLIWSIQEQYLKQPAAAAPSNYPEIFICRRFDEILI